MASLMETLIDILEREGREYRALLELSTAKTPAIVAGELGELERITEKEQEAVTRIAHLDRQRKEVTADVANVLNRDAASLKLPMLVDMLEGRREEQQALAGAVDELSRVTDSLRRVNEHNQELLAGAQEMVTFEMNLLRAAASAPETAEYNRGAYRSGAASTRTGSGFDSRQ